MTKKELQAQLAAAQLKAKTASGRNKVAVQKRIASLKNKITNFTATPVTPKNTSQAARKQSRTGRPLTNSIGQQVAEIKKKKPTKPTVAESPNKPKGRSGNIGRTNMGDFATKAKVAPKPKKNYGESGMGHKAYQNLNFNRRK